jgi:transcriptional regulator with XRE-family HTH domain
MSTATTNPGAAIRALRQFAGLRQDDVALLVGTSDTYLSKVENGRLLPSREYVATVTRAIADQIKQAA